MSTAARYNLTPQQLIEALTELTEMRQSCMIWGPPGIGKSAIGAQLAKKTSRNFIDFRALLHDPTDVHGLPHISNGTTHWSRPAFFPPENDTNRWLMLLDELPAATPAMQAALYQVVQLHRCGEHRLPQNFAIIAAGNSESDGGEFNPMSKALASRFVHFDLEVSVEDWQSWAAFNGVATETCFYISMRPDALHEYNAQSEELAFPCPRTWEIASNITQHKGSMSAETERAVYRGLLGQERAVEYCAFLKIWRELPHPHAIISNPDTAPIPENASTRIATCGSLERIAHESNIDAICTYARRLQPELGQFLISQTIARHSNLQQTRAFIQWAASQTQ